MNEGNGRMQTTKKEGRTTEDWGTNKTYPLARPRRSILRAYVAISKIKI